MATFGEKLKALRMERDISQDELATILDTSKQVISRYETNQRTPKVTVAQSYAERLGVPLGFLIDNSTIDSVYASGLLPIPKTVKRPRVGVIACGQPIMAEENLDGYDDVPEDIHCDFTLKCQGDSMINARINDGDIIYIRIQPQVENGEIAAVRVDGETTLKRFYRDGDCVTLMPENSNYAPIVYIGEQLKTIEIIGKAVGFTSVL